MVDISLVKKLRDMTGAGMMDCQKGLEETKGDLQQAVEILRKKGEKIALKKADRRASEGVIALTKSKNKVSVIILNCETDFVAKNKDFIKASQEFSDKLLELGREDFSVWAKNKIENELIVKIGENLQLGQYEIIAGDILGYYLHSNNKLATVVVLSQGSEELAKEIAMHATAMNPKYLAPADVPTEIIEKEKEIYREQLKAENKPVEIIEKIIQGKLNKFYQENCLVKQTYIKDDKINIEKLLDESKAKIASFQRFSV